MRYAWLALILAGSTGCTTYRGLFQEGAEFDAQVPTLRWAPMAETVNLRSDPSDVVRRVDDVTYEVRIYDASDRSIVYTRASIRGTHHLIEQLLLPGTYRWTVRAWFKLDGQRRVGEWSEAIPHQGGDGTRSRIRPIPIGNFEPLVIE